MTHSGGLLAPAPRGRSSSSAWFPAIKMYLPVFVLSSGQSSYENVSLHSVLSVRSSGDVLEYFPAGYPLFALPSGVSNSPAEFPLFALLAVVLSPASLSEVLRSPLSWRFSPNPALPLHQETFDFCSFER